MSQQQFSILSTALELIGREEIQQRMLSIYKETGRGKGTVVLVQGHSGIGKTSIVQWLKAPVEAENGVFVVGKFNQYHQNIPYYAVREALRKLWRIAYSSSRSKDVDIIGKVTDTLGVFGGVLAQLLPEMKPIFRDHHQIDDASITPFEVRQRFMDAIKLFFKAVCSPENPVVVFIDDWQWADQASMELLKEIKRDDELRYLMMIATYRDEEVDATHPLRAVISQLHRQEISPEVLDIKGLDHAALKTMIVRVLGGPVNRLDRFARKIMAKTRGNPFYIKAFLEFLHIEKSLMYVSQKNIWDWDMGDDVPDDMEDLFVRRLNHFDQDSQDLISLAACLGNKFDMSILSIISDTSINLCRERLEPFTAFGFILPAEEDRAVHDPPPEGSGNFQFLHDLVQQVAYLMMAPERLPQVHLKIGRLFLSQPERKKSFRTSCRSPQQPWRGRKAWGF